MITINRTQIPNEVLDILSSLQSHFYPSFLVGGCVRDLLLGKQPKDFDICTKALPEQVNSLFPKVIETGIKYGTVTVLSKGLPVEVTTFRKFANNSDGPRAREITYGSEASEDVLKRDFTINGLLFDGNQVTDYVGGLADLENRVIRAVEDPDARFREDPLRMVRAIRFCCQLGFEVESRTFLSIQNNASQITNVSMERIRDEFNKILLSNSPAKGFHLLQKTRLLKRVLPELERCFGFEQRNPHHSQDVFGHTMTVVENAIPDLKIRWAALLHDIGKPLTFSMDQKGIGHFYEHNLKSFDLTIDILTRLKFDKKFIGQVAILVKEHMSRIQIPKRSTVKRLINRVGIENVSDLLELQIADIERPETINEIENLKRIKVEILTILQEKEPLNLGELAICGDDLIVMGIKPGKTMGKILSDLMEKVIDNPELNTRERLIALVEELKKIYPELEGSHQNE